MCIRDRWLAESFYDGDRNPGTAVLVAVALWAARKIYSYVSSFNGFAAEMSDADAAKLRLDPTVLAVTKNEMVTADTSSTPAFLGLTAPGGLWAQLGGGGSGTIRKPGPGENVVIGIIDSGIWPEQLSFSDRNASNALVYSCLLYTSRCV